MSQDPRIEAAMEAGTVHLWRSSLYKCKCGWKPAPDTNIAIEVARHQTTEKLAAIDQANLITTQTQLDATPAGTVLIDSYRVHLGGDVYQKSGTGTYWQAGPQGEFTSIKLPARVIHRGTE